MGTKVKSKEELAVALTGKYSKKLLNELESYYEVEKLDTIVRKFILDAFNDLAREQEKVLRND